jgi:hypothetical protein
MGGLSSQTITNTVLHIKKYAVSGIKVLLSYKNCIYKIKSGMWKYINYVLIVINNKVCYVNIKIGAL